MNAVWRWLYIKPDERPTYFWWRLGARVGVLFFIFNLLYLAAQPFRYNSLPTIYQHLVPGRLRLAYVDTQNTGAYVVNELKLTRLVADHQVMGAPQADELRLGVYGSSEVWGFYNAPTETMPEYLDGLELASEQGKRLRVYNLAYVYADIFKDLVIADYVQQMPNAPDGILVAVNPISFQPLTETHFLLLDNADLAVATAERYGLTHLITPAIADVAAQPDWLHSNFIAERSHLAYWLQNQLYGIAWAATRQDVFFPPAVPPSQRGAAMTGWQNMRPGVLEAFIQLANDQHLPIWLVITPINQATPDFQRWIHALARESGIPLLDCAALLPPASFTDTGLHINAAGQAKLARQVAVWLAKSPDGSDPNWTFPLPAALQQETPLCEAVN
jgi:hypothetical protein